MRVSKMRMHQKAKSEMRGYKAWIKSDDEQNEGDEGEKRKGECTLGSTRIYTVDKLALITL